MRGHGHTLVEVITVVLILAAMACVAIARFSWGPVQGARADAVARQIVTDLRRTRARAILHAARNPTGFALVMRTGGYEIIDLRDSAVVTAGEIPAEVRCSRGNRFEFGPLGNPREGSDTELSVSTEAREYRIEVVPATGAVICVRTQP